MDALHLIGGIVWLLMGGDLLVRGAVALSRRMRVSPVVVAFTVVAFGTSLPELVVGVRAALTGVPGLAFGNVVGSNIANVLLVAGATAVIYPLATPDRSGRRDGWMMLAATLLTAVLAWTVPLHRTAGFVLLAGLAVATGISARHALNTRTEKDASTPLDWVLGVPQSLPMIGLFLATGLVGLPLGARLVIDAAVSIADNLGVSNAVVGLTIVAISTSLPELATTVVAAFQRRTELVLGTVIGSNLFNILGIMGATAVVSGVPIPVDPRAASLDVPLMLASSLLLVALAYRKSPMGRRIGV
ncbi:MAG: calcium/sodium antiporter, partial [Gemmatimonadetes bacterium]|nr:calcium/sodium antiporter [Gemmatimonadota bacterium]